MPVGDLMSARNDVRYSLIITVFAGFPEYFGKYIQVIGVLCGYNKFDYVDQYDKQTFVLMKWNLNITVMQFPPKLPYQSTGEKGFLSVFPFSLEQ